VITTIDSNGVKLRLSVRLQTDTNSHSFYSDHSPQWEELVETIRTTIRRQIAAVEAREK
jgi:hypothetical protein